MEPNKSFDLEAVYDEQIAPLMSQIIAISTEHKLPMMATFLYKSDPEGIDDGEDSYCTTIDLHGEVRQIPKKMDEIYEAMKPLLPRRTLHLTATMADGSKTLIAIL